MANEADRLVRKRAKAYADERAASAAKQIDDVRHQQRELMNAIEVEIPAALARLAASNYLGASIRSIAVRKLGGLRSSVKYVEKASWTLHSMTIPFKDTSTDETFALISDGYVLGPYGVRLSQRELDNSWAAYQRFGNIGTVAWPGHYGPGTLKSVLAGLRALPRTPTDQKPQQEPGRIRAD